MKRIQVWILTLLLALSLAACGGTPQNAPAPDSDTSSASTNGDTTPSETPDAKDPAPEEDNVAYTFEGEPVDSLTIEEVKLEPYAVFSVDDAQFFRWKMKVRNTSGGDLVANETSMRVFYNYLDENKDILYHSDETGGYHATVKAGQAEWLECNGYPGNWSKSELESVAYIEIYGYTTTLGGTADHEFTPPILIDVKANMG